MPSSQLLLAMCVRALIFVPTYSSFLEILAQFSLMFGTLTVVLFMLKLTQIALPAFIFQVISTNAFPLQFEKLVHVAFAANVDLQIWRFHR